MKIQSQLYLIFIISSAFLVGCNNGNDLGKNATQSIFHSLRISDSIKYVGEMSYSAYLSIRTGYKKDSVYADTVICVKKTEDSIYCRWKRIKILDDTFRRQIFTAPLQIQNGDLYLFPDYDKVVRYNLELNFSRGTLEIVDTFAVFSENTMDVYRFKGKKEN